MTILGPGRRGVLVATEDPGQARRDRQWLEDAGIPAATPADLGLHLRAFASSLGEDQPHDAALAEAWARALRRPALATGGGPDVVVGGPSRAGLLPRERALAEVGAALDEGLPRRVAVFGGAWTSEDEPEYSEAVRLGAGLAEAGLEVITGGYQGIMAAVSLGANRVGPGGPGTVVGVTIAPWSERVAVNDWLTHEVEARDLMARLPVICDADAWVAFPGGVGTLSEVALCWNLVQTESVEPRPLVIVGERWDQALRRFRELLIAEDLHFDLLRPASSADEALGLIEGLGPGP